MSLREQYGLQLGCVSMPHGKNHPAHMQRSDDGIARIVLIVMIETPEGVVQAAENAAVPGVDYTVRAVAAAGNCPGILAWTLEDEDKYAAWGARCFAAVSTGPVRKPFKQAAPGSRSRPANCLALSPRHAHSGGRKTGLSWVGDRCPLAGRWAAGGPVRAQRAGGGSVG